MTLKQSNRPFFDILIGGGIAATLDIVYAIVRFSPSDPLRVLHSVASGWLGADARQSGWGGGLLGLASHYGILFVAAAIYYATAKLVSNKGLDPSQSQSRQLAIIPGKPILSGVIFGVLVYLFMNFVVMPLSAYPGNPKYPWLTLLEGFVSHGMMVGVPIAWATARASPDS